MGLDMGLLEASVRMTPAERADRLQAMQARIETVEHVESPYVGWVWLAKPIEDLV